MSNAPRPLTRFVPSLARALTWGALLAPFVLAACGPVVMMPGGRLSGSVKAPPTNWSFTDSVDTVQLETRPDDPYSVNVWGVAVGDGFYVAAGDSQNRWAAHIEQDPRVRLKIGDDLYELRAIAEESSTAKDAFLDAARRKYDFEPDAEQRANSTLFRLEPR